MPYCGHSGFERAQGKPGCSGTAAEGPAAPWCGAGAAAGAGSGGSSSPGRAARAAAGSRAQPAGCKCSDKSAPLPPAALTNRALVEHAALGSANCKELQLLSLKLLISFWMTEKPRSKYAGTSRDAQRNY